MAGLNPGHIGLDKGRTSPLAGLEEDKAYGATGAAVGLHDAGHAALGGIENHAHVEARGLVLDGDAACAPEFKVVAAAETFPVGEGPRKGEGRVERHGPRHESLGTFGVGRIDGDTARVVGVAAERVVGPVKDSLAAAVLGQHPVELFGIHVFVILS